MKKKKKNWFYKDSPKNAASKSWLKESEDNFANYTKNKKGNNVSIQNHIFKFDAKKKKPSYILNKAYHNFAAYRLWNK